MKAAAVELGLSVITPERAGDAVDAVADTDATVGVVVAFGQILPPALLTALPEGFVNLHFSLLPRWRGAAPVERAILAGDSETGVEVMAVEAGLDTGPVHASRRVAIGVHETAGELRSRLVALGSQLLVDTLADFGADTQVAAVAQSGDTTYADKLTVDEFHLNSDSPADELDRVVRAGNPRPGAWFEHQGRRIKVWRAHLADGRLELDEVQPEGKTPMSAAAWQAGLRDAAPVFGCP